MKKNTEEVIEYLDKAVDIMKSKFGQLEVKEEAFAMLAIIEIAKMLQKENS